MPFNGPKTIPGGGAWTLVTDNNCTRVLLQGANYDFYIMGSSNTTPPAASVIGWRVPAQMPARELTLADMATGGTPILRLFARSAEAQTFFMQHD